MKIINTLTRQKEEFVPREGNLPVGKAGKINMFVCGPTVYDYIHIGNARTFVFFDVVAKYLTHKGYKVDYIQNITDIDNKIINKAKEEGKTWKEVADFYFEKFKEDAEALGITSPRYAKATDYIEEVKKQVKTLKSKDRVYLIENDGWYFDLKTFSEYGKLSGRTTEMADDAVSRVDDSDKKKNRGDFCVWKLADPEPSPSASYGASKSDAGYWDDEELGYGRPGWHIEDTAITEKEFGPQYDIHGGGQDLIFPHHEAEIAQQESASGKVPFVKYWLHVAFLIIKETKMSKSLGNFQIPHDLLKNYSSEALRFYLLSAHYRSPLDFSEKLLNQSAAAVRRIKEIADKLHLTNGQTKICVDIEAAENRFYASMDDDFNTAAALGALFELIGKANPLLVSNQLSKTCADKISRLLAQADQILGIVPKKEEPIPKEVAQLIERREKYRQNKNFTEGDKIRDQIKSLGYEIEDTIYGPFVLKRN